MLIAQHSFPASMQKMEAPKDLSMLEVLERFKVKNDRPAVQSAKQTNSLREPAYPELTVREFADSDPRVVAPHQIARPFRVSHPDTEMNDISRRRRFHFPSRRSWSDHSGGLVTGETTAGVDQRWHLR